MQGDESTESDYIVKKYTSLRYKGRKAIDVLIGLPCCTVWNQSFDPFMSDAFDVLNELWKLQYNSRGVLTSSYGIKRWEIGEIAANLGQLYFYAYQRKAELESLKNAYNFYSILRERSYLDLPTELLSHHTTFVIKKMRVASRCCIVCLLTDNWDVFSECISELETLLQSLQKVSPSNSNCVLFSLLIEEGQNLCEILKSKGRVPRLPTSYQHRDVIISNAIIGVNQQKQAKFSELSIDMIRVIQSLEWERDVRHKTVKKISLYRPTASDLTLAAASACQTGRGGLLFYLNADTETDKHSRIPLSGNEYLYSNDLVSAASRRPTVIILQGEGVVEFIKNSSLISEHESRMNDDNEIPLLIIASSDDRLTEFLTNPIPPLSNNKQTSTSSSALDDYHNAFTSDDEYCSLHQSTRRFAVSPFIYRFIANFCLSRSSLNDPFIYPPVPESVFNCEAQRSCLQAIST